jgi:predicted histidine transporter YuiF (NhaC family)
MHRFIAAAVAIASMFYVVYFVMAFNDHPPSQSQDIAAWVQAFGSVGAILVAVWVSYEQHRKQEAHERQREVDEERGLLKSLRSEIETLMAIAHARVGKAIVTSSPGTGLRTYP